MRPSSIKAMERVTGVSRTYLRHLSTVYLLRLPLVAANCEIFATLCIFLNHVTVQHSFFDAMSPNHNTGAASHVLTDGRRAILAQQRAAQVIDPFLKADLEDAAEHWIALAEQVEWVERKHARAYEATLSDDEKRALHAYMSINGPWRMFATIQRQSATIKPPSKSG
jgi:hypothetical protein